MITSGSVATLSERELDVDSSRCYYWLLFYLFIILRWLCYITDMELRLQVLMRLARLVSGRQKTNLRRNTAKMDKGVRLVKILNQTNRKYTQNQKGTIAENTRRSSAVRMTLTAEVMLIVIGEVATNDVVDIGWKIEEKSINH